MLAQVSGLLWWGRRGLCVVEGEVVRQLLLGFADALVSLETHVLALHAAPQPLDKDVVDSKTLPKAAVLLIATMPVMISARRTRRAGVARKRRII